MKSEIMLAAGPYAYAREHAWRGGWSVRDAAGNLVALVFDKGAAFQIAAMLNGEPSLAVDVYSLARRGEWAER